MNKEEFIKELTKLNINPTAKELNALEIYKDLLIEYNKKFNLTAITQEEDIYLKHFYDSLTLTKSLNLKENLNILDIGTGAGFPGLVLKIFFPNLQITLIDSNNKKISFLNLVIKELDLSNITCICTRAENLPKEYLEYFDVVTSRAVSEIRILLELSLPFLKVNGYFIPMKSDYQSELENANKTLKILNSKVLEIIEFKLPNENSKRTLIKIQKQKSISSIYPRTYDKIKKKPLN